MNFSAVILAGGKSSRMECDKAFLEIDGQPLLARQIELTRQSGAKEIFISGRADVDYSRFYCRVLTDKYFDTGPIAGIERALFASSSSHVFALAVDLPDLTVNFLRQLAAKCDEAVGAIPRIGNRIEPLAAIYPTIAHSLAEKALKKKNYALKDFAQLCVQLGFARFIDLADKTVFTNLNSPADVQSRLKSATAE